MNKLKVSKLYYTVLSSKKLKPKTMEDRITEAMLQSKVWKVGKRVII